MIIKPSTNIFFSFIYREKLEECASISVCEIGNKEGEIKKLRGRNESLIRKCKRMREYVKNLTSKCKEWEETYAEKENATQSFQKKYNDAMSKISELTVQVNSSNHSMSLSVGSSGFGGSTHPRRVITSKSNTDSQLPPNEPGKHKKKTNSAKQRLMERSANVENIQSRS
jgi:hypothetical protein